MNCQKRSIPEVREELLKLADEAERIKDGKEWAEKLRSCEKDLYRAPEHKDRAPAQSNPVTAEIRDAIKEIKLLHPDRTQTQIASIFNINHGRVSEILGGQYDHF